MRVLFHNIADEGDMLSFGGALAAVTQGKALIYLSGDLGAGKTTLVRGFLKMLGHTGRVKSPTYGLVEPYQLGEQSVYHFDLYRLKNPSEIEGIGMQDYLSEEAICLIEWPEKALSRLPKPDIFLKIHMDIKNYSQSRQVEINAITPRGHDIVELLAHAAQYK